MSNGSSKRGCFFLVLGIGGFVTLAVCGGFFAWRSSANAALEQELASVKAAGHPTTPEELSAFYALPEGAEDATQLWLAACEPFETEAYSRAVQKLPIVGPNGWDDIPPPGTPWGLQADVERLLEQYSASMKLIHQAADIGGYARFERDFSQGFNMLLEEVQMLRGASRMLVLEASVRAHRNDPAGTLESLEAMFAVGRAIENDPIIISQLVQIAVDGMAIHTMIDLLPHVSWNDEQLLQLQQMVRGRDYLRSINVGLKGERVLAMQVFLDPSSLGEDAPNIPSVLPLATEDLAMYLQLMSGFVDATGESWQASQQVSKASEAKLQQIVGSPINKMRYIRTGMVFPALRSVWAAGSRGEAKCTLADVILATERYKLANEAYPESLDELVPTYLPELPVDPYVASPLQYELRDEYPVAWCVGQDLVDDGGVGDELGEPDVVLTLNPAAADDSSEN